MISNKLIIGATVGAVVGYFVYNQTTNSEPPVVQAYPETPAINAPVNKAPPKATFQQAPPPPLTEAILVETSTVKHASHALPPPPAGVSRDSSGEYSQSRPHGHEQLIVSGERSRVPPGEPQKENSSPATPPHAPAN